MDFFKQIFGELGAQESQVDGLNDIGIKLIQLLKVCVFGFYVKSSEYAEFNWANLEYFFVYLVLVLTERLSIVSRRLASILNNQFKNRIFLFIPKLAKVSIFTCAVCVCQQKLQKTTSKFNTNIFHNMCKCQAFLGLYVLSFLHVYFVYF